MKTPLNPLKLDECLRSLPTRGLADHKGDFGHVLVVGGDHSMPGAVRMAAEAALRVGAGLVSVATHPEHRAIILAGRPEIMCHGISTGNNLLPLLEKASVVVLGPGLGQSEWSETVWLAALTADKPCVLDADGLNILAQYSTNHLTKKLNWILTPHVGEAARLLQTTPSAIQADRKGAARAIVDRFGGVCVLKGAGSLVADAYSMAINETGNPGMASGGMGDVLSGVIAGLLAQKMGLREAAELGVCLHGWAGDQAARAGQRGLLASDLFPFLREGINQYSYPNGNENSQQQCHPGI